MALDLGIFYFFNAWASKTRIGDAVIVFCAAYLQYVLVGLFLLLLFVLPQANKEKIRMFWVGTLSAVIARFGITELIRFFYHRPRPFVAHQVHQLLLENEWSFPSGHSAFFFALSTAVYCYNKKWGIIFFVGSIFMNVSRIVAGVHYPSDILGGIIIGVGTACFVYYFDKNVGLKTILKI